MPSEMLRLLSKFRLSTNFPMLPCPLAPLLAASTFDPLLCISFIIVTLCMIYYSCNIAILASTSSAFAIGSETFFPFFYAVVDYQSNHYEALSVLWQNSFFGLRSTPVERPFLHTETFSLSLHHPIRFVVMKSNASDQ